METDNSSDLLECPICCELFNNASETFCGHAFCEYCIARCLEHEPDVCPVCRNDPSPIHASFTLRRIVEEYRRIRGLSKEEEDRKSASEEKQTGNAFYLKGNFADAIHHYSNAIEETPSAILFGNRATAWFKLNQFKLALLDCDRAIKLDSNYVKAHMRKGLCLEQLKDYNGAFACFSEVRKLDKNSQLKEETEQAIQRISRFVTATTTSSATSSQNNSTPLGRGQPQQQQQYQHQSIPRPQTYSQYPGHQSQFYPASAQQYPGSWPPQQTHENSGNQQGSRSNSRRQRRQSTSENCIIQ